MSLEIHPHYAYPDHPDIEAVMRFGSVKRWHMLDTVRVQTLAEHSACVALLVYQIAKTAPRMYFGPAENLVAPALMHDLPEVYTGDIPTPTKPSLDGLVELEAKTLPDTYKLPGLPPSTIMLIKIVDLAESMRFIRLYGNRSAISKHAEDGVQAQFMKWITRASVEVWPIEVMTHVFGSAWFYAYETREYFSERAFEWVGTGMAANLARGPRDIPWST